MHALSFSPNLLISIRYLITNKKPLSLITRGAAGYGSGIMQSNDLVVMTSGRKVRSASTLLTFFYAIDELVVTWI
jgi:hypothetical protein